VNLSQTDAGASGAGLSPSKTSPVLPLHEYLAACSILTPAGVFSAVSFCVQSCTTSHHHCVVLDTADEILTLLTCIDVYMCVCLCWVGLQLCGVQIRLKRSRCRLGCRLVDPTNRALDWVYIGATWRIRLNYWCSTAMWAVATVTVVTYGLTYISVAYNVP